MKQIQDLFQRKTRLQKAVEETQNGENHLIFSLYLLSIIRLGYDASGDKSHLASNQSFTETQEPRYSDPFSIANSPQTPLINFLTFLDEFMHAHGNLGWFESVKRSALQTFVGRGVEKSTEKMPSKPAMLRGIQGLLLLTPDRTLCISSLLDLYIRSPL